MNNANPYEYKYDQIGNLTQNLEDGIADIEWNIYGKVEKVTKTPDPFGIQVTVEYRYDGTGNRIMKKVSAGTTSTTTTYLRDASGNMMAIYEEKTDQTLAVKEIPIYGSSRLGQYRPETATKKTALGQRIYEFSNHLGNVLVTLTDNKVPQTDGTYASVVVSASDYYPFGMIMSERGYQNTEYRFGFQGQEYDEETGTDHYTYRQADRITGRFWSVDPLSPSYPHNSPYAFSENRVIDGTELEGLEYEPVNDDNGNVVNYKWVGVGNGGVQVAALAGTDDEGSFLTIYSVNKISGNMYEPDIKTIRSNEYGMVELPTTSNTINTSVKIQGVDDTSGVNGSYSSPLGVGYNVYNRSSDDQWGSPYVVAAIMNSAFEYSSKTGQYIQIGDLSNRKGLTFHPHKSHNFGSQFDWRYPSGRGNYTEKDLERTQLFVNFLYKNGINSFILHPSLNNKIKSPETGQVIHGIVYKAGETSYWNIVGDVNISFDGSGVHNDHGHSGTFRGASYLRLKSQRAKAFKDIMSDLYKLIFKIK